MTDLTAFGLEPQDPPADEGDDEEESVWAECVDCEYAGYEVKTRRDDGVPLCPDCFAKREGLR